MDWIEPSGNSVRIRVRVQPGASREALRLAGDGTLRVSVTAPPVEGAANEAVVSFLAKKMRVAKTSISLEHGSTSRQKVFRVAGLSPSDVRDRLLGSSS